MTKWPPELAEAILGALIILVPSAAALIKAKFDEFARQMKRGHNENAIEIERLKRQLKLSKSGAAPSRRAGAAEPRKRRRVTDRADSSESSRDG
jgi:hypothetical protein